jgi:hypothetical protein
MKSGEEGDIECSLENDVAEQITELLRTEVSDKFSLQIVRDELENNIHHAKFIAHLNKIADTNIVTKDCDVPSILEKNFYCHRSAKNTLTVLHRLILLQIIDDFQVNSTTRKVKITFRKKEPETYKISLFRYFKNFVSAEKSAEFFEAFETYAGGNFIRKSLIFLINFVFDYIVEKRIDASDEIDEFYKAVAQNKSTQKTLDAKTSGYFSLQSSAKYLNTLIIPSLQIGTFNLKISSFDTVMKYIALAKDIIDTRNHIRESTEILLAQNEKNYTVLLLNAYTLFWSDYENETVFEKAFDRMTEGFLLMENAEKLEYEEISARRELYLEQLYMRDNALLENVAPLINIKTHLNWLESFNSKFLAGMSEESSDLK